MATLFHATLQPPSAVTAGAGGAFSGPSHTEIVLVRGSVLELLRFDASGSVATVGSTDTFAVVRAIATFRLPGQASHV